MTGQASARGALFVTDGPTWTLRIRAKPDSSRTRVLGVREGALEIAIAAPRVEGAANEELIRFLHKESGLPKSRIELVSGATGREKLLRFHGADVARLIERWRLLSTR